MQLSGVEPPSSRNRNFYLYIYLLINRPACLLPAVYLSVVQSANALLWLVFTTLSRPISYCLAVIITCGSYTTLKLPSRFRNVTKTFRRPLNASQCSQTSDLQSIKTWLECVCRLLGTCFDFIYEDLHKQNFVALQFV